MATNNLPKVLLEEINSFLEIRRNIFWPRILGLMDEGEPIGQYLQEVLEENAGTKKELAVVKKKLVDLEEEISTMKCNLNMKISQAFAADRHREDINDYLQPLFPNVPTQAVANQSDQSGSDGSAGGTTNALVGFGNQPQQQKGNCGIDSESSDAPLEKKQRIEGTSSSKPKISEEYAKTEWFFCKACMTFSEGKNAHKECRKLPKTLEKYAQKDKNEEENVAKENSAPEWN